MTSSPVGCVLIVAIYALSHDAAQLVAELRTSQHPGRPRHGLQAHDIEASWLEPEAGAG